MEKVAVSVHLTEEQKKRLEALVAHSDKANGNQSDFLRSLIDQAASEHPEIDFDDPSAPSTDEESQYHPIDFEGTLEIEKVKEILNNEKAPVINPLHCPPAWKPRDKDVRAVLMTAYYRFFKCYKVDTANEQELLQDSIDAVIDTTFQNHEEISKYKKAIRSNLDRYGTYPSNVMIVDGDVELENWIDGTNGIIEDARSGLDMSSEVFAEKIERAEEFKRELKNRGEQDAVSMVEETLEKLREEQSKRVE